MLETGPRTAWVIGWIDRMAAKYGGVLHDRETGRQWDWGQALCRQMYGPDWYNQADWAAADDAPDVPAEAISAAKAWESGGWPAWAEQREPRHA